MGKSNEGREKKGFGGRGSSTIVGNVPESTITVVNKHRCVLVDRSWPKLNLETEVFIMS